MYVAQVLLQNHVKTKVLVDGSRQSFLQEHAGYGYGMENFEAFVERHLVKLTSFFFEALSSNHHGSNLAQLHGILLI